jgi:hypothetical protein
VIHCVSQGLDSVAANRFETYEISSDPLSDHTIHQLAHWLRTCRRSHKRCSLDAKPLPKRVIDVRNVQLKLLDPSPDGLHDYVALSHCWGTCRDFLTTRDNVEDHRSGFAIGDLPRTFRDAVMATRALDIPFLWIDSICILQGDKEDWEMEGSKMAEIYSDATITICAANATDDAEGFLRTRKRPVTAIINIVCPSLLGKDGGKRSSRFYVHSEHDSRARKDYLGVRAWCLQERYLSPRIVSFGQDAIGWECFETTWAETHRQGRSTGESLFADRDDEKQLYTKWAILVEHYSRRSLTYTTDTLPALSAVAVRAAHATGDQYLAGLWQTDLLRWLLWHGTRYGGDPNRAEVYDRPKTYHAPSWSWASYPGSVVFQAPPIETEYQLFDLVCIVDATVSVEGKNPFGSAQSGHLTLRAPAFEVASVSDPVDTPEKDYQGYLSQVLSCPVLGMPNQQFKVTLDYPQEEKSGKLFAIPLTHHGGAIYSKYHVAAGTLEEGASDTAVRNLTQVYGILVRQLRCAERELYHRVGIFNIDWTPLDRLLDKLAHIPVQESKIV